MKLHKVEVGPMLNELNKLDFTHCLPDCLPEDIGPVFKHVKTAARQMKIPRVRGMPKTVERWCFNVHMWNLLAEKFPEREEYCVQRVRELLVPIQQKYEISYTKDLQGGTDIF